MIPVNTPKFWGKEKEYLGECVDSGWISSEGPFVKKFENDFSKYCQRKFGVAVANGTGALDIAVKALDLPKGSEVILPSFTIISCASAIVSNGLIPVPIDCCRETWNIDVNQIEKKITTNTKAIMLVHIYGLPCDVDPVLDLAKKYKLKVIEDAAEMHGQTYKGKICGSFGDISTFSFYPNKHITTGEGGMVLTDNEELYDRCMKLRNLCFQPQQRFIHEELGWNYRMTNMQAALGCAQLEYIDQVILRKREIGAYYNSRFKNQNYLEIPVEEKDYGKNIYWVYGLVVKSNSPVSKDEIVKKLGEKKIGTRPFFWGMHEQPVFKNNGLFKDLKLPNTEYISRNGFYIPSGLGLSDNDMKVVADELLEILNV